MKPRLLLSLALLSLVAPIASADYIVGLRFRNFVSETNGTQYLKAGDSVRLYFTTLHSATNPLKDLGTRVVGTELPKLAIGDLRLVDGGRYVEYKVSFPDKEAFGVTGEITFTPLAGAPDPSPISNTSYDCRRDGTQIRCGAFVTVVYGWGWDWCKSTSHATDPVCAHFCKQNPTNEYCLP